MAIRREQRGFYPIDWPELSHVIRFERAQGCCERCTKPHGARVWHLGEMRISGHVGLWWTGEAWRDENGKKVKLAPLSALQKQALQQVWLWPELVSPEKDAAMIGLRRSTVSLACCHLDHDSFNNAPSNLAALCQRCHLKHDAKDNLSRRRLNRWSRLTNGMRSFAFA